MAWINPSTRATGTVITAAIWNQDVVANTEYLAKPPSVSLTRTTEQSVATGTWNSVAWNAEGWDTDNMWSSTAATRIKINTAGKYLVTAVVAFTASTAGVRRVMGVNVGGTTAAAPTGLRVVTPDIAVNEAAMHLAGILSFTSTQFLRINVFQDTGVALNVEHDSANGIVPTVQVLWVSS